MAMAPSYRDLMERVRQFAFGCSGTSAARVPVPPFPSVLKITTLVLDMRTPKRRSRERPVDVLFGEYRRRILSLLLLHPEESFYVREIARLTGTPAGSLHRELKTLTSVGLLIRSAAGPAGASADSRPRSRLG
jgi:hypothetical protein